MLPTRSEKALRKLVIELAEATPEDIVAVLAMLDDRARAVVQSLLAAYTDIGNVFEMEALPPTTETFGLSEWLAARASGRSRDGDDFRLTARTVETLRTLAAGLRSEGAGA